MSNSKYIYKKKLSLSTPRKYHRACLRYLVLTINFFSLFFFFCIKIQCIYHMSTLVERQINVMMRLKNHFQIVQNLAQVTNYSLLSLFSFVIKFQYFEVPQKRVPVRSKLFTNTRENMYKNCASTEGKVNYKVDYAANFKQQIVSCRLKCLDQRETCRTICCLRLCNN